MTNIEQKNGERAMRYAMWNNKGGVGKTFLSFVLATEIAHERKIPVLLVDMCPQANLSEIVLGGNPILMTDIPAGQLKDVVETQHNCTAKLVQSVPVRESFGGATVWDGVVHVFDIAGHPKATRAYAWSSPIEGSSKRRFFAVLHVPPITSPIDAVRAAIIAERKAAK